MLIRVRGGDSGIADYLVNGRKQGREFTRDELDERVILVGDLALTDNIIKSMDSAGEKYLHITLAFKEDELDLSMLKSITEEFKNFAMAAYGENEFNFYAEAHLPKIKSYIDESTGQFVERKGHIHVVIPKTNLLSGKRLDPFPPLTKVLANGKVIALDQQTRYIDAFQEHINNKYGLASPKDNPRIEFTGQSEMIARYKGELFEAQHIELRKQFLDEVLTRKIESWDSFAAMLNQYGKAREVTGKHATYMHFDSGKGKGINLKRIFTQEFIELPTSEKIRRLAPDIEQAYITEGQARRDSEKITSTLREWHEIRAKELKYLNSGNRKFYAEYKAADESRKRQILADRESLFYARYGEHYELGRKPHIRMHRSYPPPFRRDRLHTLSELDVVRDSGGSEVLLQDHVSSELEHKRTNRNHDLRRSTDRTERRGNSVIDQALRHLDESKVQQRVTRESKWDQIKRELNAKHLLDYLAQPPHGLIIEKYVISKAADGSDRILCGKHRLNVSDFLTREMKMPWAEASPILEKLHAQQKQQTKSRPNTWEMYQAFKAKQQPTISNLREKLSAERIALRALHKQDRAQLRARHKAVRSSLLTSNDWRGKSGELKIAKMLLDKQLADERAMMQSEQKAAYLALSFPKLPSYTEWLGTQLDTLNEIAKTPNKNSSEVELQRTSIEQALARTKAKTADHTPSEKARATLHGWGVSKSIQIDIRHFKARVNSTSGTVTYLSKLGTVAFTDVGDKIDVAANHDPASVLAALQLATQKFGSGITVSGDAAFRKLCIQLAAEHGFKFSDKALNQAVHAEREHQILASAKPANTENGRYDGSVLAVTETDVFLKIPKSGVIRIPKINLPDISYIGNGERRIIVLRNGIGTIKTPNQNKERGGRA